MRLRTRKKFEVVDLTRQVADVVARAGVAEGMCMAFLGPSEAVPVRDGRLLLGTWQGIALVECDGPREREIIVDVRA